MRRDGFTLIELIVVMVIIAMLLTLAVPRYFRSVEHSKEAVLKESLHVMRDAVDKYYADNGKYPERLEVLVAARYLRKVPLDPVTDSTETWVVIPPADPQKSGVYDIRSGAQGVGMDGKPYSEW